MNQNVLVTGGAGYIGSHAVLALIEAGYRVVVVDDLSTGRRQALPDGVPLIEGDIADQALIDKIIREYGVGAVIHFAGSIVVPESVSDPLKYYRNNTAASRALIETCVNAEIHHFIFSSTAAVYGMPEKVPVSENSPTAPINPYGASKLMTEWMLRDTAAAHDFRYVALRYFNVAGADPSGRTGLSSPNATHLIKIASQVVTGQRDHIEVFGHPRRHLHPRLHPRLRSRRRPCRCAASLDGRRRQPGAQLRLRTRLFGPRRPTSRRTGDGPPPRYPQRPAPRR